jgi:hypothetical protein
MPITDITIYVVYTVPLYIVQVYILYVQSLLSQADNSGIWLLFIKIRLNILIESTEYSHRIYVVVKKKSVLKLLTRKASDVSCRGLELLYCTYSVFLLLFSLGKGLRSRDYSILDEIYENKQKSWLSSKSRGQNQL